MRLPWLKVKRPPSSSEARKLRCFFRSRAVMLLTSSRDGSGRFAATTDAASTAAIRVAVRARFNESFGLIETPSTPEIDDGYGWALRRVGVGGSIAFGQRPDHYGRQMIRVNVSARHARHVFDADTANPLRVAFEIIEAQLIGFGVGEEVGDLQILLKVKDEAASQVVRRHLDFVARHRLVDDARDLFAQAVERQLQVIGRRADVGDEASGVNAGARRDVAVGRVGQPHLVAQYARDARGEAWA